VDGAGGRLVIAGHRVEELARTQRFEAVCHLLWHGALPDRDALKDLEHDLAARRAAFADRLGKEAPPEAPDAMDALRGTLAWMPSSGRSLDDAKTIVAAIPVANAWWWRHRSGLPLVAPHPSEGTASAYLRMVTGEAPTPERERALERYLVTVSDHGMNASTFTARVIASTRSDLVSAVVGAVGALKGPLHGGAPGPVLEMLREIGEPDRARAWLARELDAGRRIMGMGHRVYRTRDPRAAVLEEAITALEAGGEAEARLRLARAVEAEAVAVLAARKPGRDLKANVEFYTAVLLDALGLPDVLFTATFAVGRSAGWTAHVLEQEAEDRLIRPQSEYVGPEAA
jgi:citrate synthase